MFYVIVAAVIILSCLVGACICLWKKYKKKPENPSGEITSESISKKSLSQSDERLVKNKSTLKSQTLSQEYQPKWGDLDPKCYLKLQINKIPSTMSQDSESTYTSTSDISLHLDDIKKQLHCNEKTNGNSSENEANRFKSQAKSFAKKI